MNKSNNPRAATEVVKFRVTRAEKQTLVEQARREGVTLSELVREAVEERCGHSVEDGNLP